MARPRRSFGHGGGSRRLTQWVGPALQGYVTVAAAGATLIEFVPFSEQTTIVRTRGQISVFPAALTADVEIVGAIGIAVVSDEARIAGVASVPEPFTDADWGGWLVWRSFSYRFEFADATGVNFPNWSFEIDSKAMRKISPSESLVVIAESQAGSFLISTPLRMLIKLS